MSRGLRYWLVTAPEPCFEKLVELNLEWELIAVQTPGRTGDGYCLFRAVTEGGRKLELRWKYPDLFHFFEEIDPRRARTVTE